MSVYFVTTYWLLGDGADEEAKRWVAHDDRKKIVYSSPRAVEIAEGGRYVLPQLPIPPEGFLVVVISDNDMEQRGFSLGVSHWGGDGGWIEPGDVAQDQAVSPKATDAVPKANSPETTVAILADADFLEQLKRISEDTDQS